MGFTVDIDTGGTFTDGFITRGDEFRAIKTPTTPHDLTVCFMECIKEAAKAFSIPLGDFLYDTDIIRFSNTIGTNSIIQRDGPKIGVIVTAGYEGLCPTADGDGKRPLVDPGMIEAIDEEVSETGSVRHVPEHTRVLAAAQSLIDRGARCLVIALNHADVNPENERTIRESIKREYPRDYLGSVPVFLSSDIVQRPGYQERINTAALNAYIHGKPPQNALRHHPRIQALRVIVNQLPVDGIYRATLHRSLGRYADQLVSRPHYRPEEGWDDLEALQQVTMGDMMEEQLQASFARRG